MRRIISALLISISSTLVLAQGAQPLELAEGAPDRYMLTIGLYELQTMTRLRLSQGGDTVILGQIQVEE